MRCSNCGKNIPAQGNVCPWCQIDKTPDRMIQGMARMCAIAGASVGFAIAAYMNEAWVVMILFGAGAGYIIGLVIGQKQAQEYRRLKKQEETVPSIDVQPANIANINRQQEADMLASGDYRKCPACAELIKSEAKVCRFCRTDIAVPVGAVGP